MGGKSRHRPQSSRAACRCFDHISKKLNRRIHHVHYLNKHEVVGKEITLYPTRYRPDGVSYDRLKYSDLKPLKISDTMILYEYLGEEYHGYPPRHPKSGGKSYFGAEYSELHRKTFYRMYYISLMGYEINYIWDHEWREYLNGEKVLTDVIHSFHYDE